MFERERERVSVREREDTSRFRLPFSREAFRSAKGTDAAIHLFQLTEGHLVHFIHGEEHGEAREGGDRLEVGAEGQAEVGRPPENEGKGSKSRLE